MSDKRIELAEQQRDEARRERDAALERIAEMEASSTSTWEAGVADALAAEEEQ